MDTSRHEQLRAQVALELLAEGLTAKRTVTLAARHLAGCHHRPLGYRRTVVLADANDRQRRTWMRCEHCRLRLPTIDPDLQRFTDAAMLLDLDVLMSRKPLGQTYLAVALQLPVFCGSLVEFRRAAADAPASVGHAADRWLDRQIASQLGPVFDRAEREIVEQLSVASAPREYGPVFTMFPRLRPRPRSGYDKSSVISLAATSHLSWFAETLCTVAHGRASGLLRAAELAYPDEVMTLRGEGPLAADADPHLWQTVASLMSGGEVPLKQAHAMAVALAALSDGR
jgi:hypothetical protein